MGRLKSLGIRKNDIVRIKFKNLNDIIKSGNMPFSDLDEHLRLSCNMRAYYNGGDFLVSEDFNEQDTESMFGEGVHIKNHFDNDYDFVVYDSVIDSIEVINDSRRFISSDMDLVVVRVDNELFINGEPLIGDEHEKRKNFDRFKKRGNSEEEYKNPNLVLLKIFEEFIADVAMSESFNKRGKE